MINNTISIYSFQRSKFGDLDYVNVDKRGTYFPHQSSDAVVSSLTTRLSLGDRPVLAPDNVANAPVDVTNDPFSYFIACSYNSANHKIRNVTSVFH